MARIFARRNPLYLSKHGLTFVEQLAADGNSMATISKALGIDRSTLYEIRKRQSAVDEAIERGYGEMEDELVHILMQKARDPKDKGSTTAAIFLLKSRRGYEGTRQPSHLTIVNDNRQQSIALPNADDMNDYMKRVANGTGVPLPDERPKDAGGE